MSGTGALHRSRDLDRRGLAPRGSLFASRHDASLAARWEACQTSPMSSETETLALHLVHALYNVTDGKPQQWRMLAGLDGATADAIEFAVARGWMDHRGRPQHL